MEYVVRSWNENLFTDITVISVTCDGGSADIIKFRTLNPIHCKGARNEELEISPKLPQGLIFTNNTISGSPPVSVESQVYTVTSKLEIGDPYFIQLGGIGLCDSLYLVLWYPSKIWIDKTQSIITKGVYTKGVMIHSDVSIDLITISPSLPSGLVIDVVTRTILGVYNGTATGRNCYVITVSNSLGSYHDTICLFYTSTKLC